MPGQRTRVRRAKSGLRGRLRLRQRSSVRRSGGAVDLEPAPGVYRNRRADGLSRVVCFTPRHDLTLAELPQASFVESDRCAARSTSRARVASRGAARADVREQRRSGGRQQSASTLPDLRDELRLSHDAGRSGSVGETSRGDRQRALSTTSLPPRSRTAAACCASNDGAVSFVPYFARYPYETYVAPRTTRASVGELTDPELEQFADALARDARFVSRTCGACRCPT